MLPNRSFSQKFIANQTYNNSIEADDEDFHDLSIAWLFKYKG